jgi:AcrR family transcriptional regulator
VSDAAKTRSRRHGPRKGDLREQAILDVAEGLLAEHSFESWTVEELAKGAGLSRASLYFYFGSKQDVVTGLVARTVATLADGAAAPDVRSAESPKQAVHAAIQRTLAAWSDHGRVMQAAVELSATIPAIGALWVETVEADIERMAGVLASAGVADDGSTTGARAVAAALCWMTERAFYRASVDGGGRDGLVAAAETSEAIWLRMFDARA